MKKIHQLIGMLILGLTVNSQNITTIEYFIDSDPGLGNAISFTGFTVSSNVENFSPANIPLSGDTTPGMHVIGYRSKDTSNIWSHTNFSTFYVIENTTATNIMALEYFIDVDPGFGNATAIANFPPTSANVISNFGFNIPNNLSSGNHVIGYRTKDASNKWSLTNFSNFYVVENNIITNIVALEYFWNQDLGFNNNTIVTIGENTSNLQNHNMNASVPNLSIGSTLILFIRAKDFNGQWSHTNYKTINVVALSANELEKIGITLYPNPVIDYLNIKTTDNEPFRFVLYDIGGKLLNDIKITSSLETVNLSHLNSGTYIAYVWKNEDTIQTFKIIKN